MFAWACPCCEHSSFDPVPLGDLHQLPRNRRRAGRRRSQLQRSWQVCEGDQVGLPIKPEACSAVVAQNPAEETEERDVGRRNIIAKGLSRFEIGGSELPSQPDLELLSDRVVCVLGQNPSTFTLNGTNCYLVGTGSRRVLIDTGEQFVGAESFMENLAMHFEESGVDGLDAIVVTHMHHDHVGNIGKLLDKYGPVPVYMKEVAFGGSSMLEELQTRDQLKYFLADDGTPAFNPKLHGSPRQLPAELEFSWAESQLANFPGGNTLGEKLQHVFFFAWHSEELLSRLRSGAYPWKPLRDGDVIQTEGATLHALHMPGHAEDHMCFLLEEEHSLFSGDHVLGWGTTFLMDLKDYMASLRRMLDLRPKRLYPGHGGVIEDGVDVLARYISHRQMREQQVWDLLSSHSDPVAAVDVASALYPGATDDRLRMARSNVELILRKFVADGAAAAWTPAAMGGADASSAHLEEVSSGADAGTGAVGSSSLAGLRRVALPSAYKVRSLSDKLRFATRGAVASRL